MFFWSFNKTYSGKICYEIERRLKHHLRRQTSGWPRSKRRLRKKFILQSSQFLPAVLCWQSSHTPPFFPPFAWYILRSKWHLWECPLQLHPKREKKVTTHVMLNKKNGVLNFSVSPLDGTLIPLAILEVPPQKKTLIRRKSMLSGLLDLACKYLDHRRLKSRHRNLCCHFMLI